MTFVLFAVSIFVLLLVVVGFLSFSSYVFYQHWRYRNVPGQPRDGFFSGNVPFIQNQSKRIAGSGVNACHLQWYQKYGPVFVFWIFHVPIVVLVDPDMAKKALITLNLPKASRVYFKLASVFGQRTLGRGILTEIDHKTWRRKRAMLNPAFHRKYLMNLIESFNSVAEEFLGKLREKADGKTPVRMADEFAKVTLDIIGKVGFGINLGTVANANSEFPSAVFKVLKGVESSFRNPFCRLQFSTFPFQNSVIKDVKYLRSFATKVIEERRSLLRNGEDTPKDVLEHILKEAMENPDLDMDDLVDNFLTIFFAGQETTSSQLSFTLYEILEQPEIEQRILKELEDIIGNRNDLEYEDLSKLEYLSQVLKEGLRLHPPIAGIQRMLLNDDSFGGYKLPAKTYVNVSFILLQRSPKFWENPDVFDPDRFSPLLKENISQSIYLPFSLGPRSCIGKTLAQFEAKVLMARVLREFKFQLLPGQTAAEEENVTLRPRDGVLCTLTTRK